MHSWAVELSLTLINSVCKARPSMFNSPSRTPNDNEELTYHVLTPSGRFDAIDKALTSRDNSLLDLRNSFAT
ncbi:hypothetical protein J6590_059110 [Homalodisca vitripennis]|nr:hypothetical protein J6590_059110 [Homalodisca vitripennis]